MTNNFQLGDTVICLVAVTDVFTGQRTSPDTVTIDIYDCNGLHVVTAQPMVLDDPPLVLNGVTYNYHYDYKTGSTDIVGAHKYYCTASNGGRVTGGDGVFVLE
jgi:hypothetical protein